MVERIAYDEFAYFQDNAAEYGIAYDGPPTVRRERVEVAPGRHLSALVWGDTAPELVLLHGGAQNAHTWDTVALALARPLVRQPNLPRAWSEGRKSTASCGSCNRCFVMVGLGHPLRCYSEKQPEEVN